MMSSIDNSVARAKAEDFADTQPADIFRNQGRDGDVYYDDIAFDPADDRLFWTVEGICVGILLCAVLVAIFFPFGSRM